MPIPRISGGGVLGVDVEGTRRQLDTFDLAAVKEVTYTSDEVTAVCPITGAPDWYVVEITIANVLKGIESKSLKLYLQSFRDEGTFCEAFAATICADVFAATSRSKGFAQVTVTQKPRGGVSIKATAVKGKR